MANMFAKAKEVETPKKTKAAAKAKRTVEVSSVDEFAQLDALIKSLSTLRDTIKEEVKDAVFADAIKEGIARKMAPEGFNAVEGQSTVGVSFKKRSTASKLTEAEVELLDQHGISHTKKIVQQEQFVINSKHAGNQELLEAVSEAMEKVKDFPEDFIMLQPEASTDVVSENALNEIFQADKTADVVTKLAKVVGLVALKPSTKADIAKVLEDTKDML